MLKKLFFNPFTGFAAIIAFEWAYVRYVVPSPTALGTLGALSCSAIVALVVANVVASFTYRPEGARGAIGVLAATIVALGAMVIGFTGAAYVFGTDAALLYAGMGAVALVAAAAMRALS